MVRRSNVATDGISVKEYEREKETAMSAKAKEAETKGETPRKKGSYKSVGAQEFIVTWLTKPSVVKVAEATVMPVAIVKARAKAYRRRGVQLPLLEGERSPRLGKRIDITALNALIPSEQKLSMDQMPKPRESK